MNELEFVPRLVTAFVIGAVLGAERTHSRKPAGLRTHTLVATASAVLIALSELLREAQPGIAGDPVRVVQGVLAGIGFIGAGTIVRTGDDVSGITTAGTIWMAASLGLVAGAGYYVLAVTGAALSIVAIILLGQLEKWMN